MVGQTIASSHALILSALAVFSAVVSGGTFQARCRLDVTCDDKRTIREEFDKTYAVTPSREPGAIAFPTLTDTCTPLFGVEAEYCQSIAVRCSNAGMLSGSTSCLVRGSLDNIVMSIRCTQNCSPIPLTRPAQTSNLNQPLMILPR